MTSIDRKNAATVRPRVDVATATSGPTPDSDVEDIGAVRTSSPSAVDGVERPTGVTVDLDAGDADIRTSAHELHGPPPPPRAPRSTFTTVALAEAALRETFGVTLEGQWSIEELSRVHETLSQLGPVEREAVRGLPLRREAVAGVRHGDGVTGAVFRRGDAVDDQGRRLEGASITFYDAAFPTTGDDVVDRQATMIVVLHEVGHALEGHPNAALVAEHRGGAHVAARVVEVEEKRTASFKAARAAVEALPRDRHVGPLVQAIDDWLRVLVEIGDEHRSHGERGASVQAIERAEAAVAAAAAAIPPRHRAREAATTLAATIAEVSGLQPTYLEGVKRRDVAEMVLSVRGSRVDDLDTTKDETLGRLEQAFAELAVTTTTYGETSPVENFAEAFMLYKRAPATLRQMDHGEAAYRFFLEHFPP